MIIGDGGLDLSVLTKRTHMKMHRQRRRFLKSRKRFDIIPAARRSGKTEEARHRLTWGSQHIGGIHHGCMTPPPGVPNPTFAYCAPTHQQAKRIVWDLFLAEIPKWAIRRVLQSEEVSITFITGAKLYVVGMDKPQRLEGIPLDGVVLDEYADMKPEAWKSSVRPALSTAGRPPGWAMFIGRPRGRNHFWSLFQDAQKPDRAEDWGVYFPWPSWVIMDPKEVEAARRDLDERSFRQEYGGEFLSDAGRAYYQFGPWNLREVRYDPTRDLQFAFDFNVAPGVAVVAQDYSLPVDLIVCHRCTAPAPGRSGDPCRVCRTRLPFETVTAVIDEVHLEDNSNTRRVCERLIEKWAGVHHGGVVCYGDETGGARRSSAERSDWATIEDYLSRQWPAMRIDLPSANPLERDRVVVTNSRLKNAAGNVRVFVDQGGAPNLVRDLDETLLDDNGDLDEGPEKKRTHSSDALGYLLHQRFGSPVYSASKVLTSTAM